VTTIVRTLYDYPQYYDLVFGVGASHERDFLMACFSLHAKRPVHRVFEPACGSGRLLIKLAQQGFEVSGWDLNLASVDYCNRRFERYGLPPPAKVGDIVKISLPCKVDAAFNLMSTFQLLPTGCAAESHLTSMAANIAKGGLYVLGLHLMPSRGTPTRKERYEATRGKVSAMCRIWTKQIRHRQRQVHCGMITEVRTPRARIRVVEDCIFRSYTESQIQRLFEKVGLFEPVATYDYHHDIRSPNFVDPETEDIVYVLHRR
jgi:SAM-dependent methyltransferase